MSTAPEFRPRFKFHTSLEPNQIVERIVARKAEAQHIYYKKTPHHILLFYGPEVNHFWSPQLDISMERDEELNQTLIRCLIGPASTVWTMFMFIYGLFGFIGFIGLTLGMSQWTLGKSMWALWLIPVSLIGMIGMYFVSRKGQNLAKEEMVNLKNYVDQSLECDCLALAEKLKE